MTPSEYLRPHSQDAVHAVQGQLNLSDLVNVLRRRRKPALIAGLVLLLISIAIALLLPPVYRSSATILIEQQEIPSDLIRSTVTSYADQRIQMIMQRTMTFSKLSEIIKKYDLYPDLRQEEPLEIVVQQMKDDIEHKMISAEVVDPRSGRPVMATIAFTVSYQYHSASTAQKVANELTSLFLSENIKSRTAMTQEAQTFFSDEVERLRQESIELETKVAEFKKINFKRLPELTNLNLGMLERAEREYFELSRQISALEERRLYLESQLVLLDPSASFSNVDGHQIMTAQSRVKYLQDQLLQLTASYSEQHPDVVRIRRELEGLVDGGVGSRDLGFIEKQVAITELELQQKRQKYADSHPDVISLQHRLERLRKQWFDGSQGESIQVTHADNPAYVQVSTALESAKVDLTHLKQSRDTLKRKLAELENAIEQSPQIEKEYRELLRDFENTNAKFQEMKAKQSETTLANTLEQEQKGERFTLIDPPMAPEEPTKPNRILIFLLGVFLSLLSASGLIWLLEKLDQTVLSKQHVLQLTGKVPLAVIAHIATATEQHTSKRNALFVGAGATLVGLSLLTTIHLVYMPLDVLWYVLLRKLS